MPTLASVSIPPVDSLGYISSGSDGYETPPEPTVQVKGKGKEPVKQGYKPRVYDDKPLPIAPSDEAPRKARIVSREIDQYGVQYTLAIGDVEIGAVGIEELLDYVSPYDLEAYENRAFEEEREVIQAAAIELEERQRAKAERRAERAKRRGIAGYRDPETGEVVAISEAGETTGAEGVAVGKHGRARPTYTHLYLKQRERKKRRKRDPETGELLERSDDELFDHQDEGDSEPSSSSDEELPVTKSRSPAEPKQRRRRRRDPVTGELLPLPSVAAPSPKVGESSGKKHKRNRRRRHPLTGELMPLGWRFDPNNPHSRTSGIAPTPRRAEPAVPSASLKRLSISQDQPAKRVKLMSGTSSSSRQSGSPAVMLPSSQQSQQTARAPRSSASRMPVVDLSNTTEESEDASSEEDVPTQRAGIKPPPKPVRRSLGGAPIMQAAAANLRTANRSSEQESYDDERPQPQAVNTMTSILKPMSPTHRRTRSTTEESSSVEPLLADTPQASIFVRSPRGTQSSLIKPSITPKATTSITSPIATAQGSKPLEDADVVTDEDEQPGEGEFFIEKILKHMWSDPRSHPGHLGKKPVTLYYVKWEGWDEPTWEPISSFPDVDVVKEYAQQVRMTLSKEGNLM